MAGFGVSGAMVAIFPLSGNSAASEKGIRCNGVFVLLRTHSNVILEHRL